MRKNNQKTLKKQSQEHAHTANKEQKKHLKQTNNDSELSESRLELSASNQMSSGKHFVEISIMKRALTILAILTLATSHSSDARQDRSEKQKAIFKHTHPCPATGEKSGSCHGYIIDHIKALECGGEDKASNMQWQTIEDAKAKDKWERDGCGTSHENSSADAYFIGPRGGCYKLTSSGKKRYVDKALCN